MPRQPDSKKCCVAGLPVTHRDFTGRETLQRAASEGAAEEALDKTEWAVAKVGPFLAAERLLVSMCSASLICSVRGVLRSQDAICREVVYKEGTFAGSGED